MKEPRAYKPKRQPRMLARELEANDHPLDFQGRLLDFVPGDMFIESMLQRYVMPRSLFDHLYEEIEA